jgi:hypothetical protein
MISKWEQFWLHTPPSPAWQWWSKKEWRRAISDWLCDFLTGQMENERHAHIFPWRRTEVWRHIGEKKGK